MDGSDLSYGDDEDKNYTKPFMILRSEVSMKLGREMFLNTQADTYEVLVPGVAHMQFTDLACFHDVLPKNTRRRPQYG